MGSHVKLNAMWLIALHNQNVETKSYLKLHSDILYVALKWKMTQLWLVEFYIIKDLSKEMELLNRKLGTSQSLG